MQPVPNQMSLFTQPLEKVVFIDNIFSPPNADCANSLLHHSHGGRTSLCICLPLKIWKFFQVTNPLPTLEVPYQEEACQICFGEDTAYFLLLLLLLFSNDFGHPKPPAPHSTLKKRCCCLGERPLSHAKNKMITGQMEHLVLKLGYSP